MRKQEKDDLNLFFSDTGEWIRKHPIRARRLAVELAEAGLIKVREVKA
jgi:hypothetical protein